LWQYSILSLDGPLLDLKSEMMDNLLLIIEEEEEALIERWGKKAIMIIASCRGQKWPKGPMRLE